MCSAFKGLAAELRAGVSMSLEYGRESLEALSLKDSLEIALHIIDMIEGMLTREDLSANVNVWLIALSLQS